MIYIHCYSVSISNADSCLYYELTEHLAKLSNAKGIQHMKTLGNVTKQEGFVPVFYWFYHTYWWQKFT
jgi:hypothetical protein